MIRNKNTKRILTASRSKSGKNDPSYHLCVDENKATKYSMTHIMLASAEPQNPPILAKCSVDHVDDNYLNNHISNLRWMEFSENSKKVSHFRAPKKPITIDIPNDEIWNTFSLDNNKTVYNVSNYGRLKSPIGLVSIGTPIRGKKYRQYNICFAEKDVKKAKKFYVHQLVWHAFNNALPEKGIDIMHDDNAPLLEDGTYRNWLRDLSLGTRSENMRSFHKTKNKDTTPVQSEPSKDSVSVIVEPRQRYAQTSLNHNLPTGFWIQAPYKSKGHVVVVDIKRAKRDGKHIHWKSPSSPSLSIPFKVELAKKYVRWVLQIYPDLTPYCNGAALMENYQDLSTDEKQLLNDFAFNPAQHDPFIKKQDTQRKSSMKCSTPLNCGVAMEDIPKYVYYHAATKQRGDSFIIDRHPKLDKRTWQTSQSREFSTKEKFDMVLAKLREIESEESEKSGPSS